MEVNKLREIYREKWYKASIETPDLGKKYLWKEKIKNERDTSKLIKSFFALARSLKDSNPPNRSSFEELIKKHPFFGNSSKSFDFEAFSDQFISDSKVFLTMLEHFDKDIDFEDTFQALRNVWICSTLGVIAGQRDPFNSGVFGYSMLYPYSDNYLDDPCISREEKSSFNTIFRRRLMGKPIDSEDPLLVKISKMVGCIEEKFDRDNYRNLYTSLLAIHDAQVKSLCQQSKYSVPYEEDILGISIEKGGASVVADGYLLKGELELGLLYFCYGFGVALQFMDDLTDCYGDKKCGHNTIFSQSLGTKGIERLTNKLLNFYLDHLEEHSHLFDTDFKVKFKEIIRVASLLLVFEGVDLNKKSLSRDYINLISCYCPFRLKYYSKLKKKIKKEYHKLKKLGIDLKLLITKEDL